MVTQRTIQVLLVEDNPLDVRLAQEALVEQRKFNVAVAEGLGKALELLKQRPFDVVLLDLGLPDSQGLETLLRLLQSRPGIPVVVMTAMNDEELALKAFQEGAQDFLVKQHVRDGMLGRAISYAVERGQAEEARRERLALASLNADVGLAFTRGGALREMLQLCAKSMVSNLDAAFARIWTLGAGETVLQLQASAGVYTHLDGPHSRVPVGAFKIGLIAQEKMPHLTNDVAHDPRVSDPEWAQREGMKAFAGYPLLLEERVVGVVAMFARHPLADSILAALASVANQIALGVERNLKEEALRESEERFRELTAHLHQVLWTIDAKEGKILFVSAGYEKIWGRSCQSLIDNPRSYMEGIHPLDNERMLRENAVMFQTGQIDAECRVLRPDGAVRWVWIRGYPVTEQGLLVRIVGIVEDVTEKRRLATEREDLLSRIQLHIQRMPLAYIIFDSDFRIIEWNSTAQRIFGYGKEEMLGIGPPFKKIVPPKAWPQAHETLRRIQSGDMAAHAINENLTKDGRTITCEWYNTPLMDEQGVFLGLISLAQDITTRKQAEAELHLLDRAIQAVTQGILITDPNQPDNPIVYASPSFLRLTGYAAQEAVGRNCRFLQGQDTDSAVVTRVREAIRDEQPCTVELLNYRKDGAAFWNELSLAPVRNPQGLVTHFVGVQTDVTQRRQLEDQFRQAQKMEAIGSLAGGVAHDFNNLLTIINGYSDMIHNDAPADSPVWECAREISQAGERAAALTRQLLAFSRKQVLEPKVLSLNTIVTETQRMLRRLIGEDIAVTAVLDPALGMVKADPGQIEQVLMNLAVNARDAMPQGGKLTIETSNTELDETYTQAYPDLRPGRYVMLAVADTGTGMDGATKARAFEPYFTTKELGRGTGLGLATVFGIVKQSDGHISVYSELGHGATFKIYLPRIEATAQTAVLVPRKGAARGTETILLTEDEPALRALSRRVLEMYGYTVLEASHGEQALQVAEEFAGTIHLLATDVVMPLMGGRQLADRLSAVRPGLKVLYLSGYTDDTVVRHGVLQAETAFLQKPFTPGALAQKVREVLDR